ncbi:hypothetical protein [Francisella salimarina]
MLNAFVVVNCFCPVTILEMIGNSGKTQGVNVNNKPKPKNIKNAQTIFV